MSDRFYKDIEIPDLPLSVTLDAPEAGFLQLVGREGKLAVINSLNKETILEPNIITKLIIDGGSPNTAPENFVLRFDFGGVV